MNETPDGAKPGEGETPDPNKVTPPPQVQASIPVADLSGALVDAFQKITASQPRPQAQDPIDSMSAEARQALNDEFLTNPLEAARRVSNMGRQAERNLIMQQALPMIQSQANTIVELYKTRKQRNDTYFAKVEPLFDQLMVGVDITPLVTMNEATRTRELDMRWKMARNDVLEVEMKKHKPEPLPMGNGNGGGGDAAKFEEDPWIANMKREYNLTDAQVKELEALNG